MELVDAGEHAAVLGLLTLLRGLAFLHGWQVRQELDNLRMVNKPFQLDVQRKCTIRLGPNTISAIVGQKSEHLLVGVHELLKRDPRVALWRILADSSLQNKSKEEAPIWSLPSHRAPSHRALG